MTKIFPTPEMPLNKRNVAILDACTSASDGEIAKMARVLSNQIPGLGLGGARRLLAAIGLALEQTQ